MTVTQTLSLMKTNRYLSHLSEHMVMGMVMAQLSIDIVAFKVILPSVEKQKATGIFTPYYS